MTWDGNNRRKDDNRIDSLEDQMKNHDDFLRSISMGQGIMLSWKDEFQGEVRAGFKTISDKFDKFSDHCAVLNTDLQLTKKDILDHKDKIDNIHVEIKEAKGMVWKVPAFITAILGAIKMIISSFQHFSKGQ